jgi:hypothetical protein
LLKAPLRDLRALLVEQLRMILGGHRARLRQQKAR